MSGLSRRDRRHKTAGVDPTIYWDFRPGDRVMTREGVVGTVTAVEEGPAGGAETYLVELDAGLGGGEYSPGELRALEGTTATKTAVWVDTPESLLLQQVAAEALTQANGAMEWVDDDEVHHTAADDYPELGDILVQRPNHEHAIPVTAMKKEAGPAEWLLDKWQKGYNERAPEHLRHKPYNAPSFDWCRFRKDERCMYPKELDIDGTRQAGYAVWRPEDRGHCPRHSHEAQRDCPVSEPGPNSRDPGAKVDATVPWSEGGQRGGTPSEEIMRAYPRMGGLQVQAYRWPDGSPLTLQDKVRIGYEHGLMPEPELGPFQEFSVKDQAALDNDIRPILHEMALKGELKLDSTPHSDDPARGAAPAWAADYAERIQERMPVAAAFEFTASWRDVQAKAKRIRSEGNVEIISASPEFIVGYVQGDTDRYETRLQYEAGTKRAAMWECGCDWALYSWGRSGRWKKYEGRMCSHALALSYEAQARGMFGAEVYEDKVPRTLAQPPVVTPGERRTKPRPFRVGMKQVSTDPDLQVAPAVRIAEGMLAEGTDPNQVLATFGERVTVTALNMSFRDLKAKVRGIVRKIRNVFSDTKTVEVEGVGEVDARDVVYPTYHPTLGLNYPDDGVHARMGDDWSSMPSRHTPGGWLGSKTAQADTDGVMVCVRPPEHICQALVGLGTEDFDNLHVTLAYLGKTDGVDRGLLIDVVAEVAKMFPALMGKVGGFGVFLNGDENVLVALIDSPGLEDIQVHLSDALQLDGLPVHQDHGYQPHLTLAYGEDVPDVPEEVPADAAGAWPIAELIVSYGAEWVPIPLSGSLAKAANYDPEEMADSIMSDVEGWDLNDTGQWDGYYQPQDIFMAIPEDDPIEFTDPLAAPEYLASKEAGATEGLEADLVRSFQGRPVPDSGETVVVYRDLSGAPKSGYPAKESWSIKRQKSGEVVAHTQGLRIVNVKPVFLEGARRHFQQAAERGVHAFLTGTVDDYVPAGSGRQISYFPDLSTFFMKDNRREFLGASAVTFSKGQCLAEGAQEGKVVPPSPKFEPDLYAQWQQKAAAYGDTGTMYDDGYGDAASGDPVDESRIASMPGDDQAEYLDGYLRGLTKKEGYGVRPTNETHGPIRSVVGTTVGPDNAPFEVLSCGHFGNRLATGPSTQWDQTPGKRRRCEDCLNRKEPYVDLATMTFRRPEASKTATVFVCPRCGSSDFSIYQNSTDMVDEVTCYECGARSEVPWDGADDALGDLVAKQADMAAIIGDEPIEDDPALFEAEAAIVTDLKHICPACRGRGRREADDLFGGDRCRKCDGTGFIEEEPDPEEPFWASYATLESEFKLEPEPALPEVTAEEPPAWQKWHPPAENDPEADPEVTEDMRTQMVASCPGEATRSWLMSGGGPSSGGGGPSDGDIAARARQVLAGKTFTPAEQAQLINEGEGVTASNLDRLDIAGTHYEALEAALKDEEEGEELWLGV